MNREIKFRYWLIEEKKMTTNEDYFTCDPEAGILQFADQGWHINNDKKNVREFICMQFTGLKDKNSKEIYEGDIVKNEDARGGESEVVFENGCFCLKSPWMKEQSHLQLRYYTQFYELKGARIDCMPLEVIGNIYENQDLLK